MDGAIIEGIAVFLCSGPGGVRSAGCLSEMLTPLVQASAPCWKAVMDPSLLDAGFLRHLTQESCGEEGIVGLAVHMIQVSHTNTL